VLIGLVVSRDGYPLGYEVFAGNRHDSTTLQEIVRRMEALYGRQGRIWVLDRGMISEASLSWLRGRGSRYIVGTPRSRLKQFAQAVRQGDWEALREGLEVQRCPDQGGIETFILCRSADRASKEQAMRERFVARIVAGLQKIRAACRRRRCAVGAIERRVGRLLGQNPRAARLFRVQVEVGPDGGARVRWSRRRAVGAWAQASQGCYVLRSNVADWDADELWRAYMHLTDAEICQADCTSSNSCCRRSCSGYDSGDGVARIGPLGRTTQQESTWRIRMSDNARTPTPPRAGRR